MSGARSPHRRGGLAEIPYTVEALGEDALLLRFGGRIDVATNARVHAVVHLIQRHRPAWLRDLVPGYTSLALFVDGDVFDPGVDPVAEAAAWLRARLSAVDDGFDQAGHGRRVEIAVRYGGEHGPDLEDVAAATGMPARAVIERHCAVEYQVAMLGFAPGFPYLLGLDPALTMPRLHTPREKVAAGSVGIGGAQTGIYPREGPGGWRIIGRTAQTLFDPQRQPPALLAPGDRVRFVAVDDDFPADAPPP